MRSDFIVVAYTLCSQVMFPPKEFSYIPSCKHTNLYSLFILSFILKGSHDICLEDEVITIDFGNWNDFISTKSSIKGPSSVSSLFVISIWNIILVLFVSSVSSKYSILLYPINILLSIFDKEHIFIGISKDEYVPIFVYDNKEVKVPSESLILPRNESCKHATNK